MVLKFCLQFVLQNVVIISWFPANFCRAEYVNGQFKRKNRLNVNFPPPEISCVSSFFLIISLVMCRFLHTIWKNQWNHLKSQCLDWLKKNTYPTVKINNVLSVAVLLQHMAKPWAASSGLAAAVAAMSMVPQQRQPWHWVAIFCWAA